MQQISEGRRDDLISEVFACPASLRTRTQSPKPHKKLDKQYACIPSVREAETRGFLGYAGYWVCGVQVQFENLSLKNNWAGKVIQQSRAPGTKS